MLLSWVFLAFTTGASDFPKGDISWPRDQQVRWQSHEIEALLHFGMNTFTAKDWGSGTEEPGMFAPTFLRQTNGWTLQRLFGESPNPRAPKFLLSIRRQCQAEDVIFAKPAEIAQKKVLKFQASVPKAWVEPVVFGTITKM